MKMLICIIATLSLLIINSRAQEQTNYDERKFLLQIAGASHFGKGQTNNKLKGMD